MKVAKIIVVMVIYRRRLASRIEVKLCEPHRKASPQRVKSWRIRFHKQKRTFVHDSALAKIVIYLSGCSKYN